MSHINKASLDDMLHAYVDGFLSVDQQRDFEKRMQDDPQIAEKVAAYREQNSLLHALYDPVLQEKTQHIPLVKTPRKYTRVWLNIAASIALLVIGGTIGWNLKNTLPVSNDILVKLVQPATIAYSVYASEIKHPVEVGADQEQHLVNWLSKRLGKPVHAPALAQLGFNLIGGRLLPASNGPAAQFMYEDKNGNRLTLYVRVNDLSKQNTAFHFYEQNGTKAFYWIDGALGYALTGNVEKSELLSVANTVYQQLSF